MDDIENYGKQVINALTNSYAYQCYNKSIESIKQHCEEDYNDNIKFIDEKKKIVETLGENFFVQLKASDCINYTIRKAYSRGNVAKGGLTQNKEEYIDIVIKQLELLNPKIVIHRITSDPDVSTLVEPTWLIKKFCLLNDIDKEMVKRDTYQGKYY